jgi:hypothetical protein
LTSRPRLRRKRKTGEREQRERGVNNVRFCFHLSIFFLLVCFACHRGTVPNPIRGYAESCRDPPAVAGNVIGTYEHKGDFKEP